MDETIFAQYDILWHKRTSHHLASVLRIIWRLNVQKSPSPAYSSFEGVDGRVTDIDLLICSDALETAQVCCLYRRMRIIFCCF